MHASNSTEKLTLSAGEERGAGSMRSISHPKSRDLQHVCITGDECGPMLKRGGSVDQGASGERPHPKE